MVTSESMVWPAHSRASVQVHFGDAGTYEGAVTTPLSAFVDAAYPHPRCPIVAALVEGELEELSYPVTKDIDAAPLDTATSDGMRIYQRSLSFLLVVAARELLSGARVVVDHSVAWGGFYCSLLGRVAPSQAELQSLEEHMHTLVVADEPILKERLSVEQAKRIFAAQGDEDKVRLLGYCEQEEITLYKLHGLYGYFCGYMLPSTGKLAYFSLQPYQSGFVLRVPQRQQPTALPPARDFPKLHTVFREYGHWLGILGLEDMSELNEAVEGGRIREAVLVSEALHEKRIAEIADAIACKGNAKRLVLIAGPSSSGKTTFARRLAIQLRVNELKPFALGLDDYFVDREHTPHDEQGNYDFESLEAIDLPLFNEHLLALLAGQPVCVPRYDFKTGKRTCGPEVQLAEDTVIIVEGIHGLNPKLVADLPAAWVYRIYISALTQLNIDHHNRVPTTDTRLIRRIVRDAQFRGYAAQETIERWESVRRGEERWIFPYQENADVLFNSALVYELAVLKPFVEPLLLRIPHGTQEYLEAQRLLAFLKWVRPCQADLVPSNSLLREFIGGSILAECRF